MRWLIKSFYFAILCVSHQPFLVLLMCSSMFILYYKYDDVGSRQQSRLVAPSLPYNKQSGIFDQIYTTSKPAASILHSYRTFHIHTYGLLPKNIIIGDLQLICSIYLPVPFQPFPSFEQPTSHQQHILSLAYVLLRGRRNQESQPSYMPSSRYKFLEARGSSSKIMSSFIPHQL